MPDKIILDTPRYKGEFELDIEDEPLTALEWRWAKKISGYTLGTAGDAITDTDPSFYIAMACVALVRAGRIQRSDVYQVADELSDLPFDGSSIRYVGAVPEETDVGPPAGPAAAPVTLPPPGNTGGSSNSTSARPEPSRSPTGAPA